MEGVAAERFEEMLQLELAFPDERMETRKWIGECVGTIYMELQGVYTLRDKVALLGGLAKAMWKRGYNDSQMP